MLLIVQIDAVNLPSLNRLMDQGRLPTLANLRQRGQWLPMTSLASHFEGAVSQSLHSGVEVADHGIYYPFQWSAAEQRVRYYHDFPAREAVWERLSRAGRRSLVIDAYEARPSGQTVGICVGGWQFTNRVSLRSWSSPRSALAELSRRFGRPQSADEVFGQLTITWLLQQRKRLLAGPGRVADATLHFLKQGQFDLVWSTFVSAHFAGHQFFDLSHLVTDATDEDTRRTLEGTLDDVYEEIDRAMGHIVEAAPTDADVFVFSPYGMSVNTTRVTLLPDMLRAILSGSAQTNDAANSAGWNALWRLRSAVPADLRGTIARLLPDRFALELAARLELRGLDWRRTRAFVLPGDDTGYIRLNLQGRERDGIVPPGEAEPLMKVIAAGLQTFRDISGGPTVASVEQISAVVSSGERAHQLPDLHVRWTDTIAKPLKGVISPEFGVVHHPGWDSGRSGAHSDDAWLLVLPRSLRIRDRNRPPRVEDIAATACALLTGDTAGLAGESLLEPQSTSAQKDGSRVRRLGRAWSEASNSL